MSLMTVSTLAYESVNYILELWPAIFEANDVLFIVVSIIARVIFMLTYLWLAYSWVWLVKKFVQRKQAKLG